MEKAQKIAAAHVSRLDLWRILFELSEIAGLQGRHDDQTQLLGQSRELIDYISEPCGRPEVLHTFLNGPVVRRALGKV
ncbi:MAG: hypothetical protein OSB07_00480 [Dehalococcoidia bacterium]|nr:hypothetical protein [Dehalococcoidia bacterium]